MERTDIASGPAGNLLFLAISGGYCAHARAAGRPWLCRYSIQSFSRCLVAVDSDRFCRRRDKSYSKASSCPHRERSFPMNDLSLLLVLGLPPAATVFLALVWAKG